MLRQLCVKTSILTTLSISTLSFAHNFTSADEMFVRRGEGYEQSTQARKMYEAALKTNLTEDEKVYAVTQMTRLDIYRGGMIEDVGKNKRKEVLEQCVKTAAEIRSTNRQEYHYATIACIAFRGKISSTVGKVKWALKLRSAEQDALEATKQDGKYVGGFEGGGILRIMSAVRGNRKAKPLGLYNPEEALSFANVALQTKAMEVKPFPSILSGGDFHENYYYIGQSQVALGIEKQQISFVEEGLQTIETAIERLDELEELEELPEGREPETKFYKKMMKELRGKIKTCLSEGNWKSCLIKKLD